MRVCIPVTEDRGAASPVSAHLGAAPLLALVETEGGALRLVPNRQPGAGGVPRPLAALQAERVDGLVVAGIGEEALGELQAAGLRVWLARPATVAEAVEALRAGALSEAMPVGSCTIGDGGAFPFGPGR
jgi:predicted Fe-Mo cluster-binding NifX family protein